MKVRILAAILEKLIQFREISEDVVSFLPRDEKYMIYTIVLPQPTVLLSLITTVW